ncbi:hypothetical protein [Methanobrevibacter sp.]|uniref:hypothetical protein n=1 Tax=Methanobrevibacter sp. TaxID=66852 RepID=UPI00388FDEB2
MNKKILIALIAIIIIFCAIFALTNNNISNASVDIDANALEDRGSLTVDANSMDENKGFYHSQSPDVNTILVKNGGSLKLTDSILNKTGDTATSGDDADFYGVNSAVLVNTNGTLDISNVEINTDSKGSNGIFVTNAEASGDSSQGGEGSQPPEMPSGEVPGQGGGDQPGQTTIEGTTEANIKNVKITTHSDKSRGLDATYNGVINAENVIINTDGQSCAALATDRGEGQVHVKSSEINTGVSKESGRGSPLIYSTGNITLENSKGTAYVSQIACIEGKNSIEISGCDLKGYGGGNRQDGDTYVDLGGVFIYQSMSGDADVGTSHFKATNSKLSIPSDSPEYSQAPMFHVTNTACVIDLVNTELSFGSNILLEVSSQNQWGNVGSNGGTAELNTNNENIEGNVIVDSISSLTWNMENTQFKGAINSTGNTTVNVAGGSTWTLTGDSTLSNLTVSGNIEYGDYSITVNGQKYDSSNPFNG